MKAWASKPNVVQNLRDAGCCSRVVEEFLSLGARGDTNGQLRLLSQHRQQLLDTVHRKEQQICCLDYLVYEMEKGGETETPAKEGGYLDENH